MTAEEFYSRRDKRTELKIGEDARLTAQVLISIGTEEADTFEGQIALLALANLTARWCRRISLDIPHVPLHPLLEHQSGMSHLDEAALDLADRCDPFGDFSLERRTDSNQIRLHVGPEVIEHTFSVCGRGWLAHAGYAAASAPNSASVNPLGAVLAACIASSHSFRQAIGDKIGDYGTVLSVWNLESDEGALDGPELRHVNLGRVAIIGVGAIGASILWLMGLAGVEVESLHLIDRDIVDFSNLNRVPIFFAEDVPRLKVEVARDFARHFNIEPKITAQFLNEILFSCQEYDLIVPGANEHGVQIQLMSGVPPIMVAGSTGPDWDSYMQRHIPLKEDCLECRRATSPEGQVQPLCSSGSVAPVESNLNETGALPFLSVSAAVMAVGEMVKMGEEIYPAGPNQGVLWFRSSQPMIAGDQKKAKAACHHCWNPRVFMKLQRGGRFARLSSDSSDTN